MSDAPILLAVPADDVFVTVRGIATIVKDPAATRFYGVDLTEWLTAVGDELASGTVELEGIDAVDTDTAGNPIVVLAPNDTTGIQKAMVKLSGGVEPALATFTFETVGGEIDVRRIRFLIRER